ncbi:MAG: DNA primase small subunit PriS [Candidatus Methanomethylicia archaeon]|nr:DNA primase small subunit PriS [Candidatus Methanomethylicia archaeon]
MVNVVEGIIRSHFRNYYSSVDIEAPSDIEKREFGFIFIGQEGMRRHLSFKNISDLKNFIVNNIPLHIYFSSAYYDFPDVEDMDGKVWRGADLVFDIDADHISTPCKREHDSWRCMDCGYFDLGSSPEECPKCSSKRIEYDSWFCDLCLERAKDETFRLVEEFLVSEFGFSIKDIVLVFSGHRGYHVHVRDKNIIGLNVEARREIVDYIKGIGLLPELHGFPSRSSSKSSIPPSLSELGWRGRLIRAVYDFVSLALIEDLESIVGSKNAKLIYDNKELILSSFESSLPSWPDVKGLPINVWSKIASSVLDRFIVHIDERVTSDIKRLIRLSSSLHGKTGLIAKSMSVNYLESFQPIFDASAFGFEDWKIHVFRMPKILIGGNYYGPYENENVILPKTIALYLMCRGSATLLEG